MTASSSISGGVIRLKCHVGGVIRQEYAKAKWRITRLQTTAIRLGPSDKTGVKHHLLRPNEVDDVSEPVRIRGDQSDFSAILFYRDI